jgi:CheY-like chemotaxis protein
MRSVEDGPLTALVVDDHEDTRHVFRRLMERWGCRVIEAADGEEAIRATRENSPDVVLLDLNMPRLDGLAAAEKIRALRATNDDIRIIAITAFDIFGMKEAAMEVGCDDYITKPIVADELNRALRRLMPLWF